MVKISRQYVLEEDREDFTDSSAVRVVLTLAATCRRALREAREGVDRELRERRRSGLGRLGSRVAGRRTRAEARGE